MIATIGRVTSRFLTELSSLVWFLIQTLFEVKDRLHEKRAPIRRENLFSQTRRVGVDSIPLVTMVSVFLGLTMTILTGYQLRRFGTENMVPSLIAVAFTRELGPLLTGIVLAARVGAAFTAELGSMMVAEEVDAIEGMGIGPLRYLAAPRIIAILLLLPCLSIISNLTAILGSALIARDVLGMSTRYFLDTAFNSLLIRDIVAGVFKSFLFGLIIGTLACYKGLTVRGGAAGVGTATTSSVVTAISTVIASDMIFNMVLVSTGKG